MHVPICWTWQQSEFCFGSFKVQSKKTRGSWFSWFTDEAQLSSSSSPPSLQNWLPCFCLTVSKSLRYYGPSDHMHRAITSWKFLCRTAAAGDGVDCESSCSCFCPRNIRHPPHGCAPLRVSDDSLTMTFNCTLAKVYCTWPERETRSGRNCWTSTESQTGGSNSFRKGHARHIYYCRWETNTTHACSKANEAKQVFREATLQQR